MRLTGVSVEFMFPPLKMPRVVFIGIKWLDFLDFAERLLVMFFRLFTDFKLFLRGFL